MKEKGQEPGTNLKASDDSQTGTQNDNVKDGQKAIEVHKQVSNTTDAEEKNDAEKWRNEG